MPPQLLERSRRRAHNAAPPRCVVSASRTRKQATARQLGRLHLPAADGRWEGGTNSIRLHFQSQHGVIEFML